MHSKPQIWLSAKLYASRRRSFSLSETFRLLHNAVFSGPARRPKNPRRQQCNTYWPTLQDQLANEGGVFEAFYKSPRLRITLTNNKIDHRKCMHKAGYALEAPSTHWLPRPAESSESTSNLGGRPAVRVHLHGFIRQAPREMTNLAVIFRGQAMLLAGFCARGGRSDGDRAHLTDRGICRHAW